MLFLFRFKVESLLHYGVDWDGPLSSDDERAVTVPTMGTPLSTENMEELISQINPLAYSDDFGVDLYVQTVHFVSYTTV